MLHRPSGVNINIRKIDFRFDDSLPRNWFSEKIALQILCDITSLMFPAGEGFFIDSIRRYRSRITDPELQRDVVAFIAQESMHTRQHQGCNKLLKSHSKYAKIYQKLPEVILKIVSAVLPARTQLAVTCALEHFTALWADQMLRKSIFYNYANPVYAGLWIWHAIEESEHKAVCFDVYQLFFGGILGYIERCIVMIFTTLIVLFVIIIGFMVAIVFDFPKKTYVSTIDNSRADGPSLRIRKDSNHSNDEALLAGSGLLNGILRPYLAYFRPSFHPWQHDNSELLQRCKNDYQIGLPPDIADQAAT